ATPELCAGEWRQGRRVSPLPGNLVLQNLGCSHTAAFEAAAPVKNRCFEATGRDSVNSVRLAADYLQTIK
ncbi:hypothetical protein, partial [Thermincola ferriacetica]|uniref:hypothetical protein n=1 Tax=Thermincola ferriacetica TaxID=281456 RepID=UPI001A9A6E3A